MTNRTIILKDADKLHFARHLSLILLVLVVQVFESSAQCTSPPKLSFNQCSNSPLSFDNLDSNLTCAGWFINKTELDSLSARVNLGSFGSTMGTAAGIELVKVDSNWYGFYTNVYAYELYRLDFGISLSNIPSVTPVVVNNIGSITSQ